MGDSAKISLSSLEKLEFIKKLSEDNKYIYVEIDENVVDVVYNFYNIISNSTVETVISQIGTTGDFVSHKQHSSIVCLYIGFFCFIVFDESVLKHKIVNSYYKISYEMGNSYATYRLALHYYKTNKNVKAIKYFKTAIEFGYPKPWYAHYRIAESYYYEHNYGEAINYYKLVLDYDLNSTHIFIKLAWSSYTIGEYEEAIKYYEKDLLIYPERQASGYYNIGCCYNEKKDADNTIKYFEKALESGHEDLSNIWRGMGYAYGKKDCDKALYYYEMALPLLKNLNDKAAVHINIAIIYFRKFDDTNALFHFKSAYKIGSYSTIASIGVICDRTDNYVKGLKYFKKAVILLKDGHITSDLICYHYRALFLRHENYDEILTFYIIRELHGDIIFLLNKPDSGLFQHSTISDMVNYFNGNQNGDALSTFISNSIRLKIELLDLHFKYAINSGGYDQAKDDFYKIRNIVNNESVDDLPTIQIFS